MSSEQLILAIDQGTTNTKALLMAHSGHVVATASRPVAISYPAPGWVEQDAAMLWDSVVGAIQDCLGQIRDARIMAVGASNQRESAVVWDRRTGQPVGPCIVWQCRRTAGVCARLRECDMESFIRARSGLTIDPLFSAPKIAWLLDNTAGGRERAARGELCAGTVDSWLLWNLTGGVVHATDVSNASRTQLLNIQSASWDPDLLELFGVPAACLPEVLPSSKVFGFTKAPGVLPAGVPIGSLIGDSHSALFAHAAFQPGIAKATYGTGSSLMTLTDAPVISQCGLSSTIAWGMDCEIWYALEGNITNTGGAIQWLGSFLGLPDPVEGVAALANTVPNADGVYMVPAFAGLGAPHWDAGARGLIFGLTRGSTAAHVARATLESIAFQVHDVLEAMRRDTGACIPVLLADGGASRNDTLMQFQADILGCPVVRSSSPDLSARGAALLAGLATGFWKTLAELEQLPRECELFEPAGLPDRRTELLAGWNDALARTMSKTRATG